MKGIGARLKFKIAKVSLTYRIQRAPTKVHRYFQSPPRSFGAALEDKRTKLNINSQSTFNCFGQRAGNKKF